MINEQEIKRLFSKLQNIQTGTTTGGNAGSRIWLKLPQNQVQATCIKDVDPGDCLGVKADDGQWYVTQASPASGEERSRRQISYRRCEQKDVPAYPVITGFIHYLVSGSFGIFGDNVLEQEVWITGSKKYKKKQLISNDPEKDVSDVIFNPSSQFVYGINEVFVLNKGRGRFLMSLLRINLVSSSFLKESILIKDSNKPTVVLTPNLKRDIIGGNLTSGSFGYMGNGIWQSCIEDGLGLMLNSMPTGLRLLQPRSRHHVPNFGTEKVYTDGISGSFINGNVFVFRRADGNITPIDKNFTILDGEIIENSGAIDIDLSHAWDFFIYVIINDAGDPIFSNDREKNDYNFLLNSEYYQGTIAGQYDNILVDPYLSSLRQKTISHTVWLPNSEGGYIDYYANAPAKEIKTNPGSSQEYRLYDHIESMSGKLLLCSWQEKYIVHQFNNVTLNVKLNPDGYHDLSDPADYRFSEVFSVDSQLLTLKSFKDVDYNLQLNTSGKFLSLPKGNLRSMVEQGESSFNINLNVFISGSIRPPIEFFERFAPDFDLGVYVGENIITSVFNSVEEQEYLIRGVIISLVITDRITFDINITEKTKLPKNNILRRDTPPFERVVLSNGCFWNYYFSLEPRLPHFRKFKFPRNMVSAFRAHSSFNRGLICDQINKFVHTNPITYNLCAPHEIGSFYSSESILSADNLVGDSIYRVNYLPPSNVSIGFRADVIGNRPSEIVRTLNHKKNKKINVSEWKIDEVGDIKYKSTFAVRYAWDVPYFNAEEEAFEGENPEIHQTSSSYHPAP